MLDISKIIKVYSGKKGCMCGCLGKYSYTAMGADQHDPGYDVTDQVNERSVKIIAKKVLTNPRVEYTDNIAYVEEDGRIKAIYFAR